MGTLSLESFVSVVDNSWHARLASDLTIVDEKLIYVVYMGWQEYTAHMTSEEQLFFALLVLESEGR